MTNLYIAAVVVLTRATFVDLTLIELIKEVLL